MNVTRFLVALSLLFISCNKRMSSENQDNTGHKHLYKDIYAVVNDTAERGWVKMEDTTYSLTLRFFQDTKDTVSFAYSAECWIKFPYKIRNDIVTVYWDTIIDSKYNFDIVQAVRKSSPKYIGKPFMELSLENDSILKASYIEQDVIKNINRSVKGRTAFPEQFTVSDVILF